MADSKTVVLVADDEPSTLAMVSAHLRSRGYTVHEASDGDQAWELAHEHLPDLVVLDVMMPGMGGWELCKRIREAVSLAHTGVIMLTGIGDTLNEMTSPLYGADAYVDKPFEFANLDRKIESTLARRRDGALGRPAFEEDGADSGPGGRPGLAKAKPKRRPKGTSALPSQLSLPNTKAASGSGAPRGVPAKPKPVAPKAAKQKKKAAAKPKPVPAKKAPKKASTKPIKKAPKKAPAKPKPVAAKKAAKKAPAKPIKKAAKKAPAKPKPVAAKKAAKKAPAKPIKKAPKKTARKAAMPKKKTGGKSKKR